MEIRQPADKEINCDELWTCFYNTYKDAYYNEIVADMMLRRWSRFEDVTKLLLAVTTSGSAIATWTIWNSLGFWRYLWAIISGFAALLSIFSSSLGVGRRLDDWGQKGLEFAQLRIDTSTILQKMSIDPSIKVDVLMREFKRLRSQYRAVASTTPVDWLQSKQLAKRAAREFFELDEFTDRSEKDTTNAQ